MRVLLPCMMLAMIGCHQCPRLINCPPADKSIICEEPCEKGRTHKPDCPPEPCPKPVCEVKSPPCPKPPEIEVRAPKPIHVKIPSQKIIVQSEVPQPQFQPQAMMQPQSFAPQSFAPQAAPAQQMMMMPVMQPQSAPAGRARPGFTFDTFRLPIPYLRLIAVPEAVPTMQVQAVAVAAPQAFAPQAAVAPQAFVPQAAPQIQPHAMMPVQGSMNVPVQGSVNVPFQTHVPVPVQPHGFVPQSMPAFMPQAVVPQQRMIPVVPQSAVVQPQMQGITLEQAEEFCRLVEQLKKQQSGK